MGGDALWHQKTLAKFPRERFDKKETCPEGGRGGRGAEPTDICWGGMGGGADPDGGTNNPRRACNLSFRYGGGGLFGQKKDHAGPCSGTRGTAGRWGEAQGVQGEETASVHQGGRS